jgi:uncharacterized membrane protein YhhN
MIAPIAVEVVVYVAVTIVMAWLVGIAVWQGVVIATATIFTAAVLAAVSLRSNKS